MSDRTVVAAIAALRAALDLNAIAHRSEPPGCARFKARWSGSMIGSTPHGRGQVATKELSMLPPSSQTATPSRSRALARNLGSLVVAFVATLLVPGSALGATVSVSGTTLAYSAAAGEANAVTISRSGDAFSITDAGATISPGAGCGSVSAREATCSAVGITRIDVFAGDLNDVVSQDTATESRLYGQGGDDKLTGGPGPDGLQGGLGADVLIGLGGVDQADYRNKSVGVVVDLDGVADDGEPGEGDNVGADIEDLEGGSGPDVLIGNEGPNQIDGNGGADVMRGLGGVDEAEYNQHTANLVVDLDGVADDGGPGEGDNASADLEDIVGGSGNDVLTGNNSWNTIRGNAGADVMTGLGGRDTVIYDERTTGVVVDLDGIADDGSAGENDNAGADMETIVGGKGDDRLTGNAADNDFRGLAGADAFFGLEGQDQVLYEEKTVDLAVSLDGVADDGAVGEGDNVATDVEDIESGSGNDVLIGSASDNELDGRAGSDTLIGLGGRDIAQYNNHAADVTVDLDGVADDGAAGENDRVAADFEDLEGGLGNDTLTGDDAANLIVGHAGNDRLEGGGGLDLVLGDAGADLLASRDGEAERVSCGTGADTVIGDRIDTPDADCETVDVPPSAPGTPPAEVPPRILLPPAPGTTPTDPGTRPAPGTGPEPPSTIPDGPRTDPADPERLPIASVVITNRSRPVAVSSRGLATLKLRGKGDAVWVSVTLTATEPVKSSARQRGRAAKKGRQIVIGRGQARVPRGRSASVRVSLNSRGRRLLAREQRLRSSATLRVRGSRGQTSTVRKRVTLVAANAKQNKNPRR